jgi:hypothetical protein
MNAAGAAYMWDVFSLSAGAGLYESDLVDQGFTSFVRLSWTVIPNIALF